MIQRKGYVYRFINDNNITIYVGKTINMENRMKQHFSSKSHLVNSGLYQEVQRIEYMTCKDEFESLKIELYYINRYKPKYNTASKIKQFVDIDSTVNDKWKVCKVIRALDTHQELQNKRISKWLPVAMCLFFFGVVGLYIFR